MNSHEYAYMVQLQEILNAKGKDITDEAKKMLMQYEESLNEVFELCDQYFGDDGGLN